MGTSRRYSAYYDRQMDHRILQRIATEHPLQTLTDHERQADLLPVTRDPQPKPCTAWVRFGPHPMQVDAVVVVWNDLAWPDGLPAANGAVPIYLRFDAQTPTLTLTTPTPEHAEKDDQHAEDVALTWNTQLNSADVAYILFQAPVLVAVHTAEMLRARP